MQVEEQGAQLGGRAGGEVADGVERGAGLDGLGIPQLGGGLRGQVQADEGLGHRVVQVAGEAAPLGPRGRAGHVRHLRRVVARPTRRVAVRVTLCAERSPCAPSCSVLVRFVHAPPS